MALVPVGRADITVESTADGYSESVTVESDDAVYVDSHAEASASATATPSTVVVEMGEYHFHIDENDSNANIRTRVAEDGGQTNNSGDVFTNESCEIAVIATEENGTSTEVNASIEYYENGDSTSTTYMEFTPFSFSGNDTVERAVSDVAGFYEIEFWMGNNNPDTDLHVVVELRVDVSASATIDSKSVVTDDIHK